MSGQQQARTNSSKAKTNAIRQIVSLVLIIGIWVGLVYAGYWYIQDQLARNQASLQKHIDLAIRDIQETNALNIQSIQEKLDSLQAEMEQIKLALEEADASLNSSNATREVLSDKIEELDRQLEELRQSLEILKESSHEKN